MIRLIAVVMVLGGLVAGTACSGEPPPSRQDVLVALTETVIVPQFQSVADEMNNLLMIVRLSGNGTRFLHDGRARSIEEAILWHGGEGAAARDAFRNFTREALETLCASRWQMRCPGSARNSVCQSVRRKPSVSAGRVAGRARALDAVAGYVVRAGDGPAFPFAR